MASYVFNAARRGWTSNGGTAGSFPYPPLLPQWNSAAGTFRLVLLGGGGDNNGLNATDASDAETLEDIALGQMLALYEFSGQGYAPPAGGGGVTFTVGGVEGYSNSTNKSSFLIGSPIAFTALGPGTAGRNTVTDILIYHNVSPGSPLDGVPIVRFDLGTTYTPQGATMTLTWTGGAVIDIG